MSVHAPVTAATVSASVATACVATATVGHRRDDYRHHDNRRRCDLRRRRDANRASLPAAPAETSTVCVPAPIESGPVPAVEIEAIIPSAEDELRLLD
jgi:hypothetical protein